MLTQRNGSMDHFTTEGTKMQEQGAGSAVIFSDISVSYKLSCDLQEKTNQAVIGILQIPN